MMGKNVEASTLYAKGLRFRRVPKVVEKYWEVGLDSVYMSSAEIRHNHLGKYGNRGL